MDTRIDNIMPILCKDWVLIDWLDGLEQLYFKTNIGIKQKDYLFQGLYPIVDQSQEQISGYTNDEKTLINTEKLPLIIFGDHTRIFKYVDFQFSLGADGCKILKPIKEINAKFFFYYLLSLKILSSGYSRHYKFLKTIQIPLPPLAEQLRIVEKLDAILPRVKAAKARLEKIPVLLKRFRQSVLAAACSGKLTEDWRDMHLETGEWSYERIDDVFNIFGGGTPRKSIKDYWGGEISWVSSGDVKRDFIFQGSEYITHQGLRNSSSKLCPINSIIVVVRSGILRHTLPVAIIKKEVAINQDIKCFYCEDEHKNYWLYFYLKANQDNILSLNREGTTVQSVKLGTLTSLIVSFPPIDEIKEVIRRVEKLFAFADSLEAKYNTAMLRIEKIEKSVLAKAFRGELAPKDPNDEPAEDLLKRILEEKRVSKTTNQQKNITNGSKIRKTSKS